MLIKKKGEINKNLVELCISGKSTEDAHKICKEFGVLLRIGVYNGQEQAKTPVERPNRVNVVVIDDIITEVIDWN